MQTHAAGTDTGSLFRDLPEMREGDPHRRGRPQQCRVQYHEARYRELLARELQRRCLEQPDQIGRQGMPGKRLCDYDAVAADAKAGMKYTDIADKYGSSVEEITTLNEMYLKDGLLDVQLLGRGSAWLDTGTMDSLADASDFVRVVQKRQGIQIAAPAEAAYKNGWITKEQLLESAKKFKKSSYGQHLFNVAEGRMMD